MPTLTQYEIRYSSELSGQRALFDVFNTSTEAYEAKHAFYKRAIANGCARLAESIDVCEVRTRS